MKSKKWSQNFDWQLSYWVFDRFMIFWPYAAFWPFLFSLKSCAGKSNATHPSKYVVNHQHHQTPRNSLKKLLQAIWAQIMNKNGKKWRILMKKIGFKTNFRLGFKQKIRLDFKHSSTLRLLKMCLSFKKKKSGVDARIPGL